MTTTNGISTSTSTRLNEGVVEAVNERGVRINGEWANVSKFRPLELPNLGARARVEVDTKGFIQSVQVLEEYRPDSGQNSSELETNVLLEQKTARLTVLKAAAHFAAARTDIKSADVLRIADSWLAWVQEPA